MKHFNVTFEPDKKQIAIHAGANIIEAAAKADIILNTACGAKGTCGKCKVILLPQEKTVLACQYHIDSDITVRIPDSSRFFEQKILKRGIDVKSQITPTIYKKYEKLAADGHIFGIAVDIGTTTVVVKLLDMKTGHCLSTSADLNPQIKYGDDVISRIDYAKTDENLAYLQKIIIARINYLISNICHNTGITVSQIYEACIVGNTTMQHILLKFPVTQLGQSPYQAYSVIAHDVPPVELGLEINPAGNVHTVENISGFVGSDTTAVALATAMDSIKETALAVDIGTNGEIVLASGDKLYASSCAAGPAFEGARITRGSRAVSGAIESVIINSDDIEYDVIGNTKPHSICGSGLIDALAVMLNLGIIDSTGCFVETEKLADKVSPKILSRCVQIDSQPAFIISHNGPDVFLTQRDIRQAQLAKAAIRTGIELLLKKMRLTSQNLEKVFLAGAFGNYIRIESALRIGLLPQIPVERIHFVGNAAGSGAEMALLSDDVRKTAKILTDKIEFVELANEPDFTATFSDSIIF